MQWQSLRICPSRFIFYTAVRVVYLKPRSDKVTSLLEAFEWFCSRHKIISKILAPCLSLALCNSVKIPCILCFYAFDSTISSSYNSLSSPRLPSKYLFVPVQAITSSFKKTKNTFLILSVYYFLLIFLYSVHISIITWNLLCNNYLLM